MASKILMGDMPELMGNILNNLINEYDTSSLYSCALVNQHWCKVAIPILWRDPFHKKRPFFISRYFSSTDEKVLKKHGINKEFPQTLFDYARFLKDLDLPRFEINVKKWIKIKRVEVSSMNFVFFLLFQLFIESGATLYKFKLPTLPTLPTHIEFIREFFHVIERNNRFFSRLQWLILDITPGFEVNLEFLKALSRNTRTINKLTLKICSNYKPELCEELIQIIRIQNQLGQFKLIGDGFTEYYGIISALESQKASLQEVIIENCSDNSEFEVLRNCKNLEILRIRWSDMKLSDVMNFKITTLEIVHCQIGAHEMSLALRKYGMSIQRLKLNYGEFLGDLESLRNIETFCPNLTYLFIKKIEFSKQLVDLIGNLPKIQTLLLWCNIENIPEDEMKIRVMQFAKTLPLTLKFLKFGDDWLKQPYINIFKKHCNASLERIVTDPKEERRRSSLAMTLKC